MDMDQSWEKIDSGWDDEPELDTADAQAAIPAQEPQSLDTPAVSTQGASTSAVRRPAVDARPKRTRARGKQSRRVERSTGSAKAGSPSRNRPRVAKPRDGVTGGRQRAGSKGLPSWFFPVAVFVVAVGVFVLALVATAD